MSSAYELFRDDDAGDLLIEPSKTSYPVQNLDRFLGKIYGYFLGKGFFNIFLARFLNLCAITFAMVLSGYLLTHVNYSTLLSTYDLKQAFFFQGILWWQWPCVLIAAVFLCVRVIQFFLEMKDFWEIRRFYLEELRIPNTDIETIEWREVVSKLVKVPRLCILKEEMTPLDVANRIMRTDNYFIVLINKELLNLKIPLPFLHKQQFVTKTLEWGISYTIFNYLFDHNNVINKDVLDPLKRSELAAGLRRRFRIMGFISLLFSPFVFVFLLIYFIFQYGEQFHNRPNSFAVRQWSPLARWKFRELNELLHVFQKRLKASYLTADKYVSSFSFHSLTIVARFISFIVGSLVGVLLMLSFWNEDMLFNLEIVEGRSAVWFVGVGGTIVAACRSLIPDENVVLEPDAAMEELVQFTHYMPKSWVGKSHTSKVLTDFTRLFDYKITIFVQELASVLFSPLVLMFSLPQSADRIIDFFCNFTIEEPGVGYICKFAKFPLAEHGNKRYGVDSSSNKRNRTKQGKMEKSFLNFKANHPEWKPDEDGQRYLVSLTRTVGSASSMFRRDPDDNNRSTFTSASDPQLSVFESTSDKHSVGDSIASLNKIHRMFFKSQIGLSQEDVVSDKEL